MKRTYYKIGFKLLALVLVGMSIVSAANQSKAYKEVEVIKNQSDELSAEYKRYKVESQQYKLDNQPNREYLGEFVITYYDACVGCCGKTDGITKSGAKVYDGVTVAVDPTVIPLGTYIYIDGIGYRVAQDIGGAVKGNKIDVYVGTHDKALQLGKSSNIKVWRML